MYQVLAIYLFGSGFSIVQQTKIFDIEFNRGEGGAKNLGKNIIRRRLEKKK
jgi:hypothetical protein